MAENGWNEYQLLVLDKLEGLQNKVDQQRNDITDLKVDIGQLKVKSGVWGAIAGFITVGITLAITFIKNLLDR